MSVGEVVFLMVAGAMAAKAMLHRWPGASRPPRPPKEPDGPRTHYRTAGTEDDADDDDVPAIDPALSPGDRRVLRDLWRAYRAASNLHDAEAMRVAAERAMAAGTSHVHAYATRVRALGLAISGEARAAVEELASVSAEPSGIEDPGIDLLVLCRARRYGSAMDRARRMLLVGDVTNAVRLMDRIEHDAARWEQAIARLVDEEPCEDAADYGLVREAGQLKGRNDDAARVGEAMFERAPDPDLAWAIAGCWLRARDTERALAWAHRAAQAGSREWERLDGAELTGLASDPGLPALRAALEAT